MPPRIPERIKVGTLSFRVLQLGDGRYAFAYYEGSRRVVVKRRTVDELRGKANDIATGILNAETAALDLTAEDRRIYIAARDTLDPRKVDAVARDAAEAFTIAGADVALRDLALFYKRHHTAKLVEKTVAEVIAAMRAEKAEQDLSGQRTRELKNDSAQIAATFGPRLIADVTADELLEMVRALQRARGFGWRRRNKIRDMAVCIWRYAKSKTWLPSDRMTAAEAVQRLPRPREIRQLDTYTPLEMAAWIENINPRYRPWLLLCGFSPIRSEEVSPDPTSNKDPLRWEDFIWAKRYISLRPETAKVRGEDRIIPISDQLYAWAEHEGWFERSGLVCPGEQPSKRETARLSKITGAQIEGRWVQLKWRRNALRKTYISAMLGLCDEAGKRMYSRAHVAEIAGTSEARIRLNYKRPMDSELAKAWLSIAPTLPANVIQPKLFARM